MEILLNYWSLIILFFGIAVLYASVGFGGGSSYLAFLILFGFEFDSIRSTALICNIVVVSSGVFIYYKKGLLNVKATLPLILLSVPFAFIGGSIQLQEANFFLLLGIVLFVAGIVLLLRSIGFISNSNGILDKNKSNLFNAGLGGSIGFLSGLVGIGGGIFLSPVLHLMNWDKARKIAATASFFILINSIAGLLGQLKSRTFQINSSLVFALVLAVFVGGQIGSRIGTTNFNANTIRFITAILVLFVATRIIVKYLPLLNY